MLFGKRESRKIEILESVTKCSIYKLPNFPRKSYPKFRNACLTFKVTFFKKVQKVAKYLGYFC